MKEATRKTSHIWCDLLDVESLDYVNPWKRTADSHTGIGRSGRGLESNCFMRKGFEFEVIEMFWNQTEVVVVQHCSPYKMPLNSPERSSF